MNELRSAAELHEFLVDEVTELSRRRARAAGAGDRRGSPESPARCCPQAKTRRRCCKRSTPWLDEARRTRAASLRYLPDKRDALDQRSFLVAPLIAQQRLLGYLYADIDGAFGRFHDTDRDLLGMLAAQAAVALDNAQWSQGLEAKVAERTVKLSEALERQTATAEILQVISRLADRRSAGARRRGSARGRSAAPR